MMTKITLFMCTFKDDKESRLIGGVDAVERRSDVDGHFMPSGRVERSNTRPAHTHRQFSGPAKYRLTDHQYRRTGARSVVLQKAVDLALVVGGFGQQQYLQSQPLTCE